MRSKYVLMMFILCLARFSHQASAQDDKFKAIFIYNFTKYINWPSNEGNFVINILGSGNLIKEIGEIATKKTVGMTSIETAKIGSLSEINKCHILYITAAKMDMLAEAFLMAKEKNMLLITEKTDACRKGSCINFVSRDGKLSFEISKANIEACGLGVSSDLLKLGTASK